MRFAPDDHGKTGATAAPTASVSSSSASAGSDHEADGPAAASAPTSCQRVSNKMNEDWILQLVDAYKSLWSHKLDKADADPKRKQEFDKCISELREAKKELIQ